MDRHSKQRFVVAAGFGLLAAAMLPLAAVAQSGPDTVANASTEATVTNLPENVKLIDTVSYSDLARQASASANAPAKPYREVPQHRRPDGSPASAALNAPQLIEHPENTKVGAAAPAPAAFASVKEFTASTDDNVTVKNGEMEPPDQGLAVYNNTVAETNNEVVEFFDATTGAPKAAPVSNKAFFNDVYTAGDPQVFFDPTIQRWIFVQMSSNSGSHEGLGIAISTTSNPLGSYRRYFIRSFSTDLSGCGGLDCFPDYPKAGYDANGFYVSVDLFNAASGSFVRAATYAVSKTAIKNGASTPVVRVLYPGDFVVQPSVPAPESPLSPQLTARNT